MGRLGIKIDGKVIAAEHKEKIREFIVKRKEMGLRSPCLAGILVGNDGGSENYIKSQTKLCNELGVKRLDIALPIDISEKELIDRIEALNKDETIDGIIMQVPLPKHLNEKKITSSISFEKDVDALTDINTGKFYKGDASFVPCTPKAIIEIIKTTIGSMAGMHAVIIGRSNIVGKPVAQLLLKENATVTICHSKTKNLKEVCRSGDILIVAIGKPSFVTADFVKDGAIVIDVGTTYVDGKILGDVFYEDVLDKAAYLTPVPGGVGPVTTVMLIQNTCEAMK